MLRNKTATYALLSLYEIGRQQAGTNERMGVRAHDIANKHKLPKAYVAKILSQLANAGILHSDRGPRGGFRLNATTKEISLYDVFNSVGAIVGSESSRAIVKGLPSRVQQAMSRAHEGAAARLKELYSQTTLADILGEDGR